MADPSIYVNERLKESILAFLSASVEVWPKDETIGSTANLVAAMDPKTLAQACVSVVTPEVSKLIDARDPALWSLEPLQMVHAEEKWAASNDDIRDAVWAHVSKISNAINMSRMYSNVPDKLMGLIQGLTSDLSAQMSAGSLDMSKMNPLELGQQVLSKLSVEDMEAMSAQMMSSLGNDSNAMMRMLNSMQDMLPPEIKNQQQQMGLGDLASLMSSMSAAGGLPMPKINKKE